MSKRSELNESLNRTIQELETRLGLYKTLFPQQIRFVSDPARRKAALCSRRAGKTHAVATYLLETALKNPRSISVYCTLTRLNAKRILWPVLRRIAHDNELVAKQNEAELVLTLENNSEIRLTGADNRGEIDKLRGSAYHLVVLDEAASFGTYIDELVDEVLDPALLDHDGVLCMIGTPSAACVGKFHEATTQATNVWSTHSWTVLDNPHIPNARQWLERRRIENGWTDEHPVYKREWLGKWTHDRESLVYRFNGYNLCDEIPNFKEPLHVLGVDLGFDDDTAFQVVTSSQAHAAAYAHDGWKSPGMTVTDVAKKIREYANRYQLAKVVMDTGGLGKMIAQELTARHGLCIEAAQKTDKLGAIELLNADLASKMFYVKRTEPVLREWEVLQWDEKRRGEDPRYPNHLSDATIYSARHSIHWSHVKKEQLPDMGTNAYDLWLNEQAAKDSMDAPLTNKEWEW